MHRRIVFRQFLAQCHNIHSTIGQILNAISFLICCSCGFGSGSGCMSRL